MRSDPTLYAVISYRGWPHTCLELHGEHQCFEQKGYHVVKSHQKLYLRLHRFRSRLNYCYMYSWRPSSSCFTDELHPTYVTLLCKCWTSMISTNSFRNASVKNKKIFNFFFFLKLMNTHVWIPQNFYYIENLTIFKFWWFSSLHGMGVNLLLSL